MHSNEINEKLWNTGVYLSRAYHSFAPENLQKEWEEVSKRSALKEAHAKLEELQNTQIGFAEAMNSVLGKVTEVTRPKEDLLKRMRDLVVNRLWQGDLVAFGYEKPRRMSSEVHRLPARLWNGHIDWHTSSLVSQGLELVEIRVLTQERVSKTSSLFEFLDSYGTEAQSSTDTPHVEAGRTGRPTIKGYLEDAFAALDAAGLIDVQKPAKAHYPLVRHWLQENKPEAGATKDKPSDEGIRAHFSPLFNSLKKTRKQ